MPEVKKNFFQFLQKVFFPSTSFFNFFFKIFFLNKSFFSKKKGFYTKKFYYDKNVNIFKTFSLTLVKKNRQNRECKKRSSYGKSSGSDWREKDQ